MRSLHRVPIHRIWAGFALLGAAGTAIGAQSSAPTDPVPAGIYSAEQAERGAAIYTERCSPCHTIEQFTGPQFLLIWGGQPALNLFTLIRTTMPSGSPASLKREEYADVLAYLLRENGLPAGPTELAASDAALDAETGQPVPYFGMNGIVDLHLGLGDYPVHPDLGTLASGDITSSSPAIVVNGVVVVGNSHDRGYYPENKENIPGHIRGYDAKTGKMLWRFHVVPRPGEFGFDTWEGDSWNYTGNVSAWAPLSADSELGLVYIPTDTPTNDYYGGHRHGDNLYGTSLIALDVKTGQRKWHFQMVRHDIWNYDTPDAPKLLDATVGGRRVPVIAQATKQGFLYVLNRETGEPIWPMEDRPVPQSDVSGERTAPTQPFPTKPAPFELQGVTENDLIDFTPELKEQGLQIARQFRFGPLFNPPSLFHASDGTRGAFVAPGANGGANIPGGAAADPELGIVYVATTRGHSTIGLVTGKERYKEKAGTSAYVSTGPGGTRGPQGLPLLKPPYGSIVAIDLTTGEHLWRIPNGDTPDDIKNHPALKGVDLPVTGKSSHANILVTKTLLLYGEGRGGSPILHALDKKTGNEIARVDLPATTNTAFMTYMHGGRQFIVAAVADSETPAELVALALPESR